MAAFIKALALALALAPAWAQTVKGPGAPVPLPATPAGAALAGQSPAPAALPPATLAPLSAPILAPVSPAAAPAAAALPQASGPKATPTASAKGTPSGGLALPAPALAPASVSQRPVAEASGPAARPEAEREPAGTERDAAQAGLDFDGGAPSRESFADLLEANLAAWESGRLGAREQTDILAAERPVVTPADAARLRRNERALVAAVERAARGALGPQAGVVSRGSSARLTHDKPDPDYDLMVRLPPSAGEDVLSLEALPRFRDELTRSLAEEAGPLFAGAALEVWVDYPRSLVAAASPRRIETGVALIPVRVRDASGRILLKADVSLTTREDYANPYPRLFQEQLGRVEAAGGREAAERVLSDIRLAKRLFRETIGAYKFYEGGPTGVGVEQMVLQAGSFDALLDRVFRAAFDEAGSPRGLKKARKSWTVSNPYMAPANFLDLLSEGAWLRLSHAALEYRRAKAAGRPITLETLRWRKPRPAPPPPPAPSGPRLVEHESSPAQPYLLATLRALAGKDRRSRDKLLKRVRRRLELGGRPLVGHAPGKSGELRLRLPLRADSDHAAAAKAALKFFETSAPGFRLLELSAPAAAQRPPPPGPKPAAASPTLELLERFTLTGPKPAERGEAFLLAQGAKALPPELEAAWAARQARPLSEVPGQELVRALLLRQGGEAFIRIEILDQEGNSRARFLPVPEELTAAVASESLIEARHDGRRVTAARAIGSYPVDMVIGRVARRDGKLVLDGLFKRDGRRLAAYPLLPLAGDAREGDIAQAFVRPAPKGFEAVVLTALGRTITPEIAAREIAFRHGARGWFERAAIEQAEAAAGGFDADSALKALRDKAAKAGRRVEDLRKLPFITIDPVGAGDLDDAYFTERHPDGSWTWYLATADVGQFVKPGTPAFRAAARIGNTFYSIDKDGVPEFPMNHPVVSKHAASLLAGKDSLAMITKMRFGPDGKFLVSESDVFLGAVRVQGRYTYDQVHELWKGASGHGIEHLEQVELTRALARLLHREDDRRGKLDFDIPELRHSKGPAGWTSEAVVEPPTLREAHRLIEELKVYGNRVIGTRLMEVSRKHGAPHISRVHLAQEERINERVREELGAIGAPWKSGPIAEYLARLRAREDLSPEVKEAAQLLVLISRKAAAYAVDDASEHEGLALEGGAYDHPSTPIRRFSDMYNRAILQAHLAGEDPKKVYETVLKDLKTLGFASLGEYLEHLNGRALAARRMDLEVDELMSVYELAKPAYRGRSFEGWVKLAKKGRDATVVIALKGSPASITIRGEEAKRYELLDRVRVEIRGADPAALAVDFRVSRPAR